MKRVFFALFCLCLLSCQATPERLVVNKVVEETRPSSFNANRVVERADAEIQPAVQTDENVLVVELSVDGNISLRTSQKSDKSEDMGSLKDTTKLGSRVKELLDARENKTAFIKAPRSVIYKKVVEVINVLKVQGAHPIGLQIADLSE